MKSFEKQFKDATRNIEVGTPKYLEIKAYYDKKEYQLDVLNKYRADVCGRIISHYRQFPKLQVSSIHNINTDKLIKLGIAARLMHEALEEAGLIPKNATGTTIHNNPEF